MRAIALLLVLTGNLYPLGRTYQLDGEIVPGFASSRFIVRRDYPLPRRDSDR
jgi:hypothetical protein